MDIDRLEELIEHGYENDCLDFKEQFHENKAELLHDILCLANNTQFQNAYILFGIDDKRVTTGVENHERRINSANIHDFLNNNRSKFFNNALPKVDVSTLYHSGHEIDVLEIKSTLNVPYFLIEQYQDDKKIVHSGHIYSRSGDRNTPINQCSSSDQTIKLWEKRFGRLENHFNKFLIYLDDLSNWKEEQLQNENFVRFYYEPEPMLIVERTIDFEDADSLPYYQAQPYGLTSIYRGSYKCITYPVTVDSGDIYYIDGTNSVFSNTLYSVFQFTPSNNLLLSMDYYLENSIEYKLLSLFNPKRDAFTNLGLDMFLNQTLVFCSELEVDKFKKEVELNIRDIIKKIEESSGIDFKDAPYERRKHDLFRIHTGRILKEMHRNHQLRDQEMS